MLFSCLGWLARFAILYLAKFPVKLFLVVVSLISLPRFWILAVGICSGLLPCANRQRCIYVNVEACLALRVIFVVSRPIEDRMYWYSPILWRLRWQLQKAEL